MSSNGSNEKGPITCIHCDKYLVLDEGSQIVYIHRDNGFFMCYPFNFLDSHHAEPLPQP